MMNASRIISRGNQQLLIILALGSLVVLSGCGGREVSVQPTISATNDPYHHPDAGKDHTQPDASGNEVQSGLEISTGI